MGAHETPPSQTGLGPPRRQCYVRLFNRGTSLMKKPLAVVVLLGLPIPVFAQAAAPTPTPTLAPSPTPELPKPAPELGKLQFLVGDWAHEELHHSAPTGVAARGVARSKIAWILGGHRLYMTYKSLTPAGEHEGRGVLGWDADEKTYR